MDYIITIDGMQIVVEDEKPTGHRDRLLQYYTGLLNHVAGDLSDAQKAALETYVRNMTESAAEERLEAVSEEEKCKQTDDSAFQEVDGQERETAETLLEIIDAMQDDPEQEAVLINGNKFLFDKGSLDITKYAEKLFRIGESSKGNTWSIYLDDEGELVIY